MQTLAATSVNLDTANSFAVLGGSTVTNTGSSIINGNLGLSPGTSVIGFPPGTVSSGTIHATDGAAASAQTSLTTAYNDATGQSCDTDLTGQDLGGLTLTPGVYCFSTSAQLTGVLTLNAQDDPSAVFIFKTGSTLTTASSSRVNLVNSAQSCNIFWRIGSSATLGSSTIFTGNIIALTSITLNTSATVDGRVLARNGEVTLDSNTITAAVCAAPLINIVKVPSPLSLPDGPGLVTYNYTVTNPGVVAMSNITVTDDTCSPVSYISGDTDADNRLDTTETWSYNCAMTLSATTTNTVTATGLANGFTATDTANATVVVTPIPAPPILTDTDTSTTTVVAAPIPALPTATVPKLPNTGTSPQQNVGLGIVLVGIITVSFSLYFVRKRLKS